MTGKGWRLFKVVSVMLVVSALVCGYLLSTYNSVLAWIMLLVVALISIAYLTLFLQSEKNLHSFVSEMEAQLDMTISDSLEKFPAPALIIDEEGTIIWFNKAFSEKIHPEDSYGQKITKLIDIDLDKLTDDSDSVEFDSGDYRIIATTTEKTDDDDTPISRLTMLYFQDISEMKEISRRYMDERVYVTMIMIDNLEEMLSNSKDSDKGHITMQIDRLIENFIDEHNGVVRKNATDRYFAMLADEEVRKLEDEQFHSILDKAHEIMISEHYPVTLSVGIGKGGANIAESEELAREALEMTQGRGGDQVAIKEGADFKFFGGASQGVGKSTKVKTRIFTTSLINLIYESDNVIVMGHKRGDLDAVGSAAGLVGAIRGIGHNAYVYSNFSDTNAMPLINRLRDNIDDDIELFISEDAALRSFTENTLLIIVDTNEISQIDSTALYEKASSVNEKNPHIVYIDHHRQSPTTSISNAVINLHEPYASSAAEMVTEVIQYLPLHEQIQNYYADALLSGIMLDTKNFITKTGARTFEAAAYLRKIGADPVAVKLLFASTYDMEVLRARLITTAQVHKRCSVAIAEETAPNVMIAASQAADEMLNIEGVDAGFVVYPTDTGANISARSYGAINVQVIMEGFKEKVEGASGGGHQTMAASQLPGVDVRRARQLLLEEIDNYVLKTTVTVN
ncbi:MAG: DHH family phosphoesterase [Oscillospiraceae bacterium]|nr:DHH family phosphoesterase [Oscillospiraceae bacterium]